MPTVVKVVLALIAVWVLLGVIGFVVKGLFFLFVIAAVAFAVTMIGARQRQVRGRGFLSRRG